MLDALTMALIIGAAWACGVVVGSLYNVRRLIVAEAENAKLKDLITQALEVTGEPN